VPGPNSQIDLKVFDWNRFSSNVALGTAQIKLNEINSGSFQDLWLPLDVKGEIHVFIFVAPYPTSMIPKPIETRLDALRIHLEKSSYYPGNTLRGCVVYSCQKAKKLHGLVLQLDGRSRCHIRVHSDKSPTYYSDRTYFFARVPLVGHMDENKGKSENATILAPGSYIFPFEYVLPMELPPSWERENDQPVFAPTHANTSRITYSVIADLNVAGKGDKSVVCEFSVLFSENHTLQPALLAAKTSQNGNPIASSTQVQLHVSAPAVAFMGETYKVSARIENKGPSPIVKMTGELIFNEWYNGVSPWAGPVSWSCFAEKPRVVSIWNIGAAPGFPIAPGATWEMEFELMMPLADCTLPKASGSNGTYLAIGEAKHGLPLPTSLHATQCPNIQFAYHLEFKVSTSLNDMPKGSFDLPFYFARRNLPGMLAPSAPEGPLKTLKMAPSQGPLCRSSASLAAAAKASSSNQPAEPNSESIPAVFEPSKIS
jgi:hypothetical protein